MMHSLPDRGELHALVEALSEQTITLEQARRLERMLLTDPNAEAYYIRYMSLCADLSRCFAGLPRDAARSLRSHLDQKRPPIPALRSNRRFHAGPLRRVWLRSILGLAAALLLAVVLWPRRSVAPLPVDSSSEPTDDTVAVLLQAPGATWESMESAPRAGAPLAPGWLRLKSGVAQIEFYNGAMVILQGPARFQLISDTEAYCAQGKLRAVVPPQARGFTIGSPKLDLVDRGTEFGLQVTPGWRTEVHVFDGKVELYEPGSDRTVAPHQDLTTGQSIRLGEAGETRPIRSRPGTFVTAQQLADRASSVADKRHREWLIASEVLRQDPSLLVYYSFQPERPEQERTLLDRAARRPLHDGVIIGCAWVPGRWPGKRALEFKRISDRVRFHVPGEFDALTLIAWVRVDALPNRYASLMMTDSWESGAPHWHLRQDGKISLGLRGIQPERAAHYFTSAVFTPECIGQWLQLAVVYDRQEQQVTHYVDGRPIKKSPLKLDMPLRVGDAELGNWNPAAFSDKYPNRNFSGCMDEFLMFSRALRDEEVERLYLQGRPAL